MSSETRKLPQRPGNELTDSREGATSIATPSTASATFKDYAVPISLWAINGLTAWGIVAQTDDNFTIGVLSLVLMLSLMASRVPIAIAMTLASLLGIWQIAGYGVLEATLWDLPYTRTASWILSVLPMFILMGFVLWRSGATERLYLAARRWLQWLPGGLALTTNYAGGMLGAVSGSTVGIAYALGRIGLPEMLRAGYDKKLAMGSILMAGTGGQLIPPSILSVVYAGIAEVPVGQQLLAGLVPGLVLTFAYGTFILIVSIVRPRLVNRDQSGEPQSIDNLEETSWLASLWDIWPVPAVALLIVGGLYGGFFSATEAGAAGAVASIFAAWKYSGIRELPRVTVRALIDASSATAGILFLLVGAAVLNRLLALSGLARFTAELVDSWGLNRVGFILVMIVFYLILGMFMESVTMMLLTVPLFLPALEVLGINPIWFGAFVVLLGELAMLTPPVGILIYVFHNVASDPEANLGHEISIVDVFKAALWFIPISLTVLATMIIWPEYVTMLTN